MSIINLDNAISLDENNSRLLFEGDIIYLKWIATSEELVAEEVAKFLNIETLHFERGIYKGKEVIFSRRFFNYEEDFIPGDDILEEYHSYLKTHLSKDNDNKEKIAMNYLNNLTDIWGALELKFGLREGFEKDIETIMEKLVKIFCFDLLMGNYDRGANNWGVIVGNQGVRLAPMFDNAFSLTFSTYDISPEYTERTDLNHYLERFFQTSSSEFVEIFYEMYDKLTLDKLLEIIDLVERERGINFELDSEKYEEFFEEPFIGESKPKLIDDYNKHRDRIAQIINKIRGKAK